MTIGDEIDECMDRLNDKIEALKDYLEVEWEWELDRIVGARRRFGIELTDEELEKVIAERRKNEV